MYGRGRGSYLGLLLESQIGKNATASTTSSTINSAKGSKTSDNAVNVENNVYSARQSAPSTIPSHSQDNDNKSPQPTWTSLDLLGNRGKRSCRGNSPTQENSQVSEDDKTRNLKDDPATSLPSTSLHSDIPPDQKPKTNPVKKIHLISPEEFLLSPQANSSIKDESQAEISEIDTSSENESNTSSTSRYVPPHQRKGFSGRPDIFSDPAVTKYKKLDTPAYTSTGTTESHSPQTMFESELNWYKWKLERSFKKLLNNLSVENVVGLSVDIRKICEASQLSTKFPGTSEVNALVNLLVSRVIEQRDSFEVVVQMCRLLNVIYKDEFPANLKDVLRQYRQETFNGVANKNSRCENFCIFLGKLCDVAKDETKSFRDCLRQSVMGCLHDWISSFQTADECSQEAEIKVSYLCYLLEVTKSVLTTEKGTWIKSCFGKIKNCILSEKVPRSVKENLLDHVIKCSLQSPTTKESEIVKANAESLPSTKTLSESRLSDDAYKNVKKMLSDLGLSNLLEKFQENLIRDTLLCAEKNELKNTLQEAGFAPGAILEIQLYLEKNGDNFYDNVPQKMQETKPGRDIDPQTQIRNLENNLKKILSNIESEKEQAEIQNEDKNKTEKQKESYTKVENVEPFDFKELQDKLMTTYQNNLERGAIPQSTCPPPPGFSYPADENRTPSSSEEVPAINTELSVANHFPDLTRTREVSLGSERKSNIVEFKDENTQAGNPVVKWTQNDGKRNYNGRSSPKYKGRGRGRRDITGTLESAKDNSESLGFSGDTRGSRWNSRDMMTVRDNSGYVEWNKNSPETSRKGYGRPQSGWKDGFYERPLGYPEETSGLTTTEPQEPRGEFGPSSSTDASFGASRGEFGSSVPVGCFICGGKDHRSAYCKNNAAMFD